LDIYAVLLPSFSGNLAEGCKHFECAYSAQAYYTVYENALFLLNIKHGAQ